MKKARIILLVCLAVFFFLVAGFVVFSVIQKASYDELRDNLIRELGTGLKPARLDPEKLSEIDQWPVHSSAIGDASAHAEALKTLGKPATVDNLVELFKVQMPPYAWLGWGQNIENMNTAAVQAVIVPVSVDGKIHVSADGLTAIIIHSDGIASVYTQTEDGFVDELRHRDQE